MLFSAQCLYKDEEGERVQDNEQMMKHHPGLRSSVSAALTILSGLLQEVEKDGGCLFHTELLWALAPGLWRGKTAVNSARRIRASNAVLTQV